MTKRTIRMFSWLLALAMVLSLVPVMSYGAEGTSTWKAVAFEAITPQDTIAITMTKDGTTYALPTVAEGTKKQPLAILATVSGEILTTPGEKTDFGWTITSVDGGYTIGAGGKYLSQTTSDNNGIRIGSTPSIWNLVSNYLSTADTGGASRYLGVFVGNTPDWRSYTEPTATNIKNETLEFWVLSDETPDPTVPDPTIPDPTIPDPTIPDPTIPDPEKEYFAITGKVDGVYYAMSNTFQKKVLSIPVIVSDDGTISGEGALSFALELSEVDGGYTISYDGKYLAYGSGTDLKSSDTPYVWVRSTGTNGTWRFTASTATTNGLLFRAGKYNQFGGYKVSNAVNSAIEYFDVDVFPIVGTLTPGVDPIETAKAPTAEPAVKHVYKGTKVTLSTEEKDATILFHLGNENWEPYTTPIAIDEDTTIVAKTQKEGKQDSEPVAFYYTAYEVGNVEAVLVTDISQIASGDKIIITARDFDASLGTVQATRNRRQGGVLKSGNTCRFDDLTQILTLEAGTDDDTYALLTDSGYLYAPEDNDNVLRTQSDKTDSGSFYITIESDGTATVIANANKEQTHLRYNTSGLFSLYKASSTQKPLAIYKLPGQERPDLPKDGDTVVLYNLSTKGVLSVEEGKGIRTVEATLSGMEAICGNGTLLFTVKRGGEEFFFYNESFGYLTVKDGALGYVKAPENADWTPDTNSLWIVEPFNGGYMIRSYDGKTLLGQSGFTTAGTRTGDRDTATYLFYPCNSDSIMDGVVNEPTISFGNPAPANVLQDYILYFTVDAVFGAKELKVTVNGTELEISKKYGRYSVTIPTEMISGTALEIVAKGVDNQGVSMEASISVKVKDEPMVSDIKPLANSQTKDDKRPTISAKITNAGDKPTFAMTINGQEVTPTYAEGYVTYKPASDLEKGRTVVILTVTREDGKTVTKKWNFTVGESEYTMIFGQLHSHTAESDGAGTLTGALEYIAALPEEANVDFVAFTDHSNDFDSLASPNPEDSLYNLELASPAAAAKWTNYKNTLAKFNEEHGDELIVIPGFEMTWTGGPGHMNTFVTEGIVSRNNPVLDNKTADAGMRAYYDLLCRDEGVDSITQLNHPGATYGNFTDFAYWTPEADSRVYLVEVGNGEGAIRGDKYFPSYEEYTMALDKGWHVAPTNNQDNHLGGWGNANEARDVILVEEFTEEAIYDAIRSYRVYATEDRNLEITYTVNDLPMGTIMETAPETLRFNILLRDADEGETFSSVDLIANSGKVVYSWTNAEELASGVLTAELAPEYTYYYVRVIQGDKDIAVTAPVWVGENLRLGIKSASINVDWPVVGEELQINTVFRNGENADAIVKNIVYTANGSQVLYVDNDPHLLVTGTESTVTLSYTPTVAKLMSLSVVATVEYNGREYTFTANVEFTPLPAEEVADITIDASHKNEYVNGGYANKMQNFTAYAESANIRVNVANKTKNLIEACENEKTDAIVINAPSRRDGRNDSFTAEEIEALRKFHERGGILILSGQYDKYDGDPHTAATMNAILEAVGSSLRFMDDSVKDGTYDGVYTTEFGSDPIAEGLTKSIYYYGGSSLYAVDKSGDILTALPENVSPVLFSNSTASSADNDGDRTEEPVFYGYTATNGKTYSRMLLMAAERQEGKGMIFVSGASFMNDFNVTEEEKYGNNALAKNLIYAINPLVITPISEVQAQTEAGCSYVIEGTVTSNASGYHKDTAFFDCIYIQDETAGICCFPVAGDYKIGDVVRIRGLTDFFQGEAEIQVQTIEKIGTADPVEPTVIEIPQLNDGSMAGSLVTIKGYVKEFTITNGLVDSIYVVDENGNVGRVFIDGYITVEKEIEGLEVGKAITATGLASYDNTYAVTHGYFARIRVRDRGEILISDHTHTPTTVEAVKPTCTQPGFTEGQVCSVCTMVLKGREEIPAAGHTYDEGTVSLQPTCESDGTKTYTCTSCGDTYGEPIPTTGHTMVGDTCSTCGYCFPFTDVPANQWYREAVEYVYNNKLMNGTKTDVFAPERTLTRAMLVTILYRMAGTPEVTIDNPFADVPAGQWYTEAVLWGYENNIVKGLKADKFGPDNDVTREQMVTFLYRYATYAGYDVSVKADMSAYQDADSVSGYAVDAFAWAIGAGIVNGVTKDTLKPLGTATRAQVAKVIMVLDRLKK